MNILIFNSNNPLQTSGIVSFDFFNGLKRNGHNVRLLVNSYDKNYPKDIISLETPFSISKNKFIERIRRRLPLRKAIATNPDYHYHVLWEKISLYKTKKLLRRANIKPEAIFIMFAKDFINSKNVYELYQLTHARIFWLMYDMAPFTGGCHYAWDCTGYKNSCGNCPGLFSSDPFDISYENLLFKKNYISRTNIEIISASEWQYRQAKSSSLFGEKIIHKILLSVDTNVFRFLDKKEVRSKLGLPTDKKIVFFGSVHLSHHRKGMYYLLESLKILKEKISGSGIDNNILLLIAGSEIEEIADSLSFPYHFLGFLDNTTGIASAYQAADLFLCPSIEDSGPSMINQSLMCGTPVVSFEMGVSPDLVISGLTGYIARLKDCNDLAQGLFNVLSADDETYGKLVHNSRELALKLCAPDVQMREIEELLKPNDSN
jgi:glycosyltransferase involved in cell wall biosynthesis